MKVYGVELSFNNKAEVLELPINPTSFEVSESGQGKTYEVAGLGEINVIKDRKLAEYSFSGLFPTQRYPFVTSKELLRPDEYIHKIEKWLRAKRPIRFIIASDTYDINTPASIESFTWNETPGGTGDIEYTLKLRKYVFYAARKIQRGTDEQSGQGQEGGSARPNEKQNPKTYKMAAGDSLWKVAQTQLGNGARWKEIQKLNGITDAEIKRLPIGKVLKLP
ncbi:LysM peptidoglycan-binding domain-containing protein [Cohnella phaseoli]|uniref:Nucleoid-associated protein YgaU n=1 Tax=Cohnella phaseoli TaxID=456490 RepID=A0A3D9IUQ7_9BACL|nr:LysM peptidoglycan-binding domain-containing protein [Cohnella phaseoli]RED65472.1 nucleoid-associated protein YgaU [Cohnella phaseoli]